VTVGSQFPEGDLPGGFAGNPRRRVAYNDQMETRVLKLEADVADIKATLGALAPKIHEMHAFVQAKLPELATKADIAATKADISAVETRVSDKIGALAVEVAKRPTKADTWAFIGAVAAIVSMPYWPGWWESLKGILPH
jgi:hypothetical protein